MREKFRKIFVTFFILAALLFIGNNLEQKETVQAATSVEALKQQYPSGSTWNSNYKNKAGQCHGYACLCADALTGTDPYTWSRVSNFNSLKAGDIIRFTRPHSILVTSVSGDTVVYVDCNWVRTNTVQWDQTINKSQLTTKFGKLSAVWVSPVNINGGSSANTPNNTSTVSGKPVISNVAIKSISKNAVTFSYKVTNGTMTKIHIESVLTGQKKEVSITSGLGGISHSFNRAEFPLGGNQYRIYLYAYNGSAGKYKNEVVHKMLYGSTANVVTFPNTMSNAQFKQVIFNARFYADMYDDLKKKYGYNETKLWNHLIYHGAQEGRVAAPGFAPTFYMKNNVDVAKVYGATNYAMAFYHYTTNGIYESGRAGSPVFQGSHYLSNNKDLVNAFGKNGYVKAAIHFNNKGLTESRNSSPYYSSAWYKANNADLKKLNMGNYTLLLHYYKHGISEKRAANSGRKIPKM